MGTKIYRRCNPREEEKYHRLMEGAVTHIPNLLRKMGPITGEVLAKLYHTHGYCPEVVGGVVDVPPEAVREFNVVMEIERLRSREAFIPKVIALDFSNIR